MNRIMIAISAFVLFNLAIIGISCTTSTQAVKSKTESSAVATQDPAPAPEDGVARISATEAIALVKSGKALVIDTRDPASFETMHISGAINVPYKEFVDKSYKSLPKDKELIFYCT